MNKRTEILIASILAGMFISIGGWAFVTLGSIAGMILFTFGLLSVVHFKTPLYTGKAGFDFSGKAWRLPLILLLNVVGCFLMGLATTQSPGSEAMLETTKGIVMTRVTTGPFGCCILAMGCGLIMTTAVAFASKEKYLPLLFGVPAFIACGFPHSIADAFYICTYIANNGFSCPDFMNVLSCWIMVVVGNFIGCNIPWVFKYKLHDATFD